MVGRLEGGPARVIAMYLNVEMKLETTGKKAPGNTLVLSGGDQDC